MIRILFGFPLIAMVVIALHTQPAFATQSTVQSISTSVQEKLKQAESAVGQAVEPVKNAIKNDSEASSSSETTQEIKKRIEKVLSEEKSEIANKPKRRGFIGEVSRVTEDSLTINSSERSVIIPLTGTEVTLVKNKISITPTDIEVGNWAMVMGTAEQDTITPQIVVISEKNLRPRSQVVFIGSITKHSTSSISFIPRGKEDEQTFVVSRNTQIQDSDGTVISTKDLLEDVNCLVVGLQNDESIELLTVRSLAPLKEEKISASFQ